MSSNEDRVDAVLDEMEQSNDATALSEGLNILCKLTAKYISNDVALSLTRSSPNTEELKSLTILSRTKLWR